jgi:hypothetical protein
MGANLLLIKIDVIFFVLARDMWNVDGNEDVRGLLLKSNQDEKNSGEVIFGSLVAFDWMSGGEKDESWGITR